LQILKSILILSLTPFDCNRSRIIKEYVSLSKEFAPLIVALNNGKQLEYEIIQGVSVKRINLKSKWLPKYFLFQILKFFEFGIKTLKYYKNYNIIDCHCLISLIIGFFYKKKYNAKLVFNAHEIETERSGLSKIRKFIFKILEKKLIYKCDTVIVVSDSIREWYMDIYKIKNVFCIYNSPNYIDFEKSIYFREKYNLLESDKIFLYQGMFFPKRGIELLFKAFKKMLNTNNYLVFMGKGPLLDEIKKQALNNNHIFIHDAVPQNELYKYTSSVSFGFSIIENTSLNHEYCLPNKLFEYIMYQIPVIVSNVKDQAAFVNNNNVGYVLNEYNDDSLAELINTIDYSKYDELIINIKKIKNNISWNNQEKKYCDIYKKLA